MTLTARHEQIEHLPGVRPAIDIVSQKDVDSPGHRMRLKVGIDLREQLSQQIGTAVHVSDGIHSDTLRDPRQSFSAPGRQRVPHLTASELKRFLITNLYQVSGMCR